MENNSRRDFIRKTLAGTAALSLGGMLPGFSPKRYARIVGANDRVTLGVMGVNSRGLALASNYALQPNFEVITISDVDSRAAAKCIEAVGKLATRKPQAQPDFRKALENKDMDAVSYTHLSGDDPGDCALFSGRFLWKRVSGQIGAAPR